MSRNRMTKFGAVIVAAVLLGVVAPRYAGALIQVDNTGVANFENGAGTAQPAVNGVGTFYRQGDPVLAVDKKVWDATHTTDLTGTNIPIGTTILYEITITYPKVADVPDVCGDDSVAQNIVITDALPAQVTYTAGTLQLWEDGVGPTSLSDGADADDGEVVAGTVTVRIPTDMNEGDGDAACTAGNTRVIRVEGVVNGS